MILINHGLSRASDLAFSSLLAMVPILAVVFMTFKLFGGKEIVDNKVKPYIYSFLTPGSSQQISEYIDSFINSATIETLGSIGMVFLLITVYLIISTIEDTFNFIWNVKYSRKILEKLKIYWLIITVSPILLTVSITLTSVIGDFSQKFTLFESISSVFVFDILPFMMIVLFFGILNAVLPNCRVEPKHALVGALTGTILYYITKNIFIDYSKLAVSYNLIYGSLAVLPLFMIWVYWFWVIILLSVEITFVRQNYRYLQYSEKYQEINYYDRLKFSLLICSKMVKDYLESKDPDNVLEYSRKLKIPLIHVKNCFSNLEKSKIVKALETNPPEIYIPEIPIKEITIDLVIQAVNKKYLDEYPVFVQENKVIDNIVIQYKNFQSDYTNKSISEIIDKN